MSSAVQHSDAAHDVDVDGFSSISASLLLARWSLVLTPLSVSVFLSNLNLRTSPFFRLTFKFLILAFQIGLKICYYCILISDLFC